MFKTSDSAGVDRCWMMLPTRTRFTASARVAFVLALSVACVRVSVQRTPEMRRDLSPSPRDGHVLVSAGPTGGVWLTGGGAGSLLAPNSRTVSDSLWLWRDGKWLAQPGAPSARTLAAAAYDSRRRVFVMYGGAEYGSATRYGDTWEWDGRSWQKRVVRTPGPRDHHAMAYDEARGQVVMYGGFDYARGTDNLKETWTWDGNEWRLADTTGPGARAHHAMAYDARRQRVVMVGFVRDSAAAAANPPVRRAVIQTWEWDGSRWQRAVVPEEPAVGSGPVRMAYDPRRSLMVLVGGRDSSGALSWAYDGSRWTRSGSLGVGVASAMAFDEQSGRVTAWGGSAPFIPGRPRDQQTPQDQWPRTVWQWDGSRWDAVDISRSSR